jgi:hypothetical protein
MTSILLKLFAYIYFMLLTCYTTAVFSKEFVNITSPVKTKDPLKNIDEILKCNDCCSGYKNTTTCDIFYNLCMTEVFNKDGVFMLAEDNRFNEESKVVHRMKTVAKTKERNIIFIFINQKIVFFQDKHIKLGSEINHNIKKIEDKYNKKHSPAFNATKKDIAERLRVFDEITRPDDKLYFRAVNYNNIEFIINNYTSILEIDKEKIIDIYNQNHKQLCISGFNPSISSIETIINSSSNANNSLFFNVTREPSLYKNVGEKGSSNSTIIGITIGTAAVAVVASIVAIISFFSYKKYKRTKSDTNTKLDANNKNTITKSVEHIYEEPDLHYKSVDLIKEYKDGYRSSTMLSQSSQHDYVPCIYDSDTKASNETVAEMNHSGSKSSLHEQQDAVIPVANDGEATPYYYTLEENY